MNDFKINYLPLWWYYHQNPLVGGWCAVIEDRPPTSTDTIVADFLTEEIARHIVKIHNEWVSQRYNVHPAGPGYGGQNSSPSVATGGNGETLSVGPDGVIRIPGGAGGTGAVGRDGVISTGGGGGGNDSSIPRCPICRAVGGGGHGGYCLNKGKEPKDWVTR